MPARPISSAPSRIANVVPVAHISRATAHIRRELAPESSAMSNSVAGEVIVIAMVKTCAG